MSEEPAAHDSQTAALLEKVGALEAHIRNSEVLRRRQARIGLIGLLLVLFLFLLFIYRLYAHFDRTYYQALKDDQRRQQLVAALLSESQAEP